MYSILVPMYRDSSDVMARLIANLDALDYPKEKLDIKLICEADDTVTLAALKALRPPETMEIIAVAPSHPRTKPKACNVALQRVRGEYVVIYDAEDAPAPDQLKRAVAMFRAGPEKLACLQASLNYYNRNENILTQLFSIEYSALFRLFLPALERMGLPIPLGGTSNHLKATALRDVGGWDSFNVTEDADLGIRLAYLGYTTQTLPSLTLEESPITLGAWMKQRTRWIKGYIQTWLVFTRDTAELKRRLGSRGYYGFQFFIGAPALTFLLAPLFWLAFILSLTGIFPNALSPNMHALCAFSFVGGMLCHWLFARKVMQLEGWENLSRAFWLYPCYWLLHSAAAARALWQLITAPHYWDKTSHGMSRMGFAKKAA
jgi:cellulose synthase/poly-beta-1,6-N-acetylglucosamine synthase-like glycosyltransferase